MALPLAKAHGYFCPAWMVSENINGTADDPSTTKFDEQDLRQKLADGRLIATGIRGSKAKKTEKSDRVLIPATWFAAPNCQFDFENSRLRRANSVFRDVRISIAYENDSYPQLLSGKSLSECYRKLVKQDWLYQELKVEVFSRHSSWQARYDAHPLDRIRWWPVRFEEWREAVNSFQSLATKLAGSETAEPTPPDDLIALRERNYHQVRLLISWLRDGRLKAIGVKEPKWDDPSHVEIPESWWNQEFVQVQFEENRLWIGHGSKAQLKFSQIRISDQDPQSQSPDRKNDRVPPRGRRGRKSEWDWDSMVGELIRLAGTPDGLPCELAELERYIADWFMERDGNHPSESRIRAQLTRFLPPDYHSDS